MSTIIGIDLGTSTTEVAVIRDGKPVMLANPEGELVIPSAVGIDETGEWVVGESARAQYLLRPENTAIEVKRKIGTKEKIKLGKEEYTPVALSAKLLSYVKEYVSGQLGEEITRAVISVPAYFDDIQRKEIVEAGIQAGFQVERIINEPTAAALSYGLEHMEDESHILVYDLGGGTFDVTLLEMFGGVLEVKASSGDNTLGGKDFDERLVDWLLQSFRNRYNVNLEKDIFAMVKLKEEAKRCKEALSTQDSYHILIPMIATKDGEPLALDEEISVGQFEAMIKDLVERTQHPIDIVLADGGIEPSEIDRVLMVGGSTRVPYVVKALEEYLHIVPSRAVDPDYAVAQGAAIQAGIIQGSISQEDSIIITDVNPYTLGVRAVTDLMDDYMSVVIPRNVTIPVTRSERYCTSWDYQTEAVIEVFQGEEVIASRNHFLGKFSVEGIPAQKAGKEQIDIEFAYDINGMLNVTAKIASTGEKASIRINMMEEREKPVDVSHWKDAPGAGQFRTVIRRAERMLKRSAEFEEDPFVVMDLEECVYELKAAILKDDMEEAKILEGEIISILQDMK